MIGRYYYWNVLNRIIGYYLSETAESEWHFREGKNGPNKLVLQTSSKPENCVLQSVRNDISAHMSRFEKYSGGPKIFTECVLSGNMKRNVPVRKFAVYFL